MIAAGRKKVCAVANVKGELDSFVAGIDRESKY
jgi:hypothetical protein